jgi:RNA recognition motif-containing protein
MCGTDTKLPFEPTPGVPARCSPCKEKVDNGDASKEELAAEREVLNKAREAAKETMGMKLFIGGLPYATSEEQLTELFVAHGELKEVHIAKDKETGNSKGFAFVTYKSHKEGAAAIEALKGTKIDGRKLTIQESKPKGGRGGGGRRQNDRGRGRRDRR